MSTNVPTLFSHTTPGIRKVFRPGKHSIISLLTPFAGILALGAAFVAVLILAAVVYGFVAAANLITRCKTFL